MDDNLATVSHLAGEFKNLEDRFRQAALVSSQKPFTEFEAEVKPLFERLEQARSKSITPPEWTFKRAQKKVKSGDCDFAVDLALPDEGTESLPIASRVGIPSDGSPTSKERV